MKVLVFDIWGDYGHFRKFYTTSSPLTFSFPPPPTVLGILGAILGVGKEEYLKVFSSDKCKIALGLNHPVKKVRMGINLINTKDNYWVPFENKHHEPRTQIKMEFLKEPAFRVYFSHCDENVFGTLVGNIKEHKTVYTVSLGLSGLLADFNFVGLFEGKEKEGNNESVELSSVIIASQLLSPDGIDIEDGKKYFKEKIPVIMNPERVVEQYDDAIFETGGKNIKAIIKTYVELKNREKIAFF